MRKFILALLIIGGASSFHGWAIPLFLFLAWQTILGVNKLNAWMERKGNELQDVHDKDIEALINYKPTDEDQ